MAFPTPLGQESQIIQADVPKTSSSCTQHPTGIPAVHLFHSRPAEHHDRHADYSSLRRAGESRGPRGAPSGDPPSHGRSAHLGTTTHRYAGHYSTIFPAHLVPAGIRKDILEGKDVNQASLLISVHDLAKNKSYA